ncbi:hypothetical protein M0R72_06225 [Candidatus Pacearchaeota archaeon]|jgi:hypothetical protein|nr:hypothetical protein [Candidatus Pacearchaeota archaeon]
MKKADIIDALARFLDADTDAPSSLKPTLTDNELWGIFMQAVPELPQYRGAWGLSVYEEQFVPYYTPDTDVLSIDPFRWAGNSNVVVDDALSLAAAPASGWVQTVPGYDFVSADEAQKIKVSDPAYKRNLFYRSMIGGYVSAYDYDGAVHGVTDGNIYRPRKYPGILAVKVEMVTADSSGRTVGFDLSLDGGRSWIGAAVGCSLATEIDVSAYPSTSPVLKIILASADDTSPQVLDLRMMIWQVENIEANLDHILNLAHAIWLERLADRALAGGKQETHQMLAIMADRIRQRVAGRIGDSKVRIPETSAPSVAAGPANRYAKKYFGA